MSFLIALRLTRSYLPRPLLRDPIVQWPRTLPFHGSNTGSNPVRVAIHEHRMATIKLPPLSRNLRQSLRGTQILCCPS